VRRAIALGCWFSVGPAMLRGAKGRAIVQELPMDKILPETDGPFTMNGAAPFMPWEAINIVDVIAPLWKTASERVKSQFEHNLSTLVADNITWT